jgi:CspA family cold shock protein
MSSIRSIGSVKWFNNKSGFGFITSSDGEHVGKDIFVHYSAIKVAKNQFRYLVQGEYVEFDLVKATENSKHEFQADNISGIKGGSLMCEVQFANRPVKPEGSADEGFVAVQPKRKPRPQNLTNNDSKKTSYSKIISKK